MTTILPRESADRLALSIKQACDCSSLGRTTLYKLIKSEQIPIRKVGGRTIILPDEFEAALRSLPRAGRAS